MLRRIEKAVAGKNKKIQEQQSELDAAKLKFIENAQAGKDLAAKDKAIASLKSDLTEVRSLLEWERNRRIQLEGELEIERNAARQAKGLRPKKGSGGGWKYILEG